MDHIDKFSWSIIIPTIILPCARLHKNTGTVLISCCKMFHAPIIHSTTILLRQTVRMWSVSVKIPLKSANLGSLRAIHQLSRHSNTAVVAHLTKTGHYLPPLHRLLVIQLEAVKSQPGKLGLIFCMSVSLVVHCQITEKLKITIRTTSINT